MKGTTRYRAIQWIGSGLIADTPTIGLAPGQEIDLSPAEEDRWSDVIVSGALMRC